MKLGTLKNDTRDGALCVVARDLKTATVAYDVAPTLQAALDDWPSAEPRLRGLACGSSGGAAGAFALDPAHSPRRCRAPSSGPTPAPTSRISSAPSRARGAEPPPELRERPAALPGRQRHAARPAATRSPSPTRPGASTSRPRSPSSLGDVPHGLSGASAPARTSACCCWSTTCRCATCPRRAGQGLRLLPVEAVVRLLAGRSHARRARRGLGRPPPAPARWRCAGTARSFGAPDAGADMDFDFPTLIAHAARTRALGAGTLARLGHRLEPRRLARRAACIAERRALEMLEDGNARTPFLAFGDRVEIEMRDTAGRVDLRLDRSAGDASRAPLRPPRRRRGGSATRRIRPDGRSSRSSPRSSRCSRSPATSTCRPCRRSAATSARATRRRNSRYRR